jgi:hypothetical protein
VFTALEQLEVVEMQVGWLIKILPASLLSLSAQIEIPPPTPASGPEVASVEVETSMLPEAFS